MGFVNALPDRLKLYALLAFNTGCNNTDVGHLTEANLDLTAGTIVRKRVKTEGCENVPTTRYYLWAETKRLLQQEMTHGAEYLLLDAKGKPLYVTSKEDGGSVYDKLKSQWRDVLGRSDERPYTPRDFRDFGSIMLQRSNQFRSYRQAWLGHSPTSVADRNYRGEEDVTEACKWMEAEILKALAPAPSRQI